MICGLFASEFSFSPFDIMDFDIDDFDFWLERLNEHFDRLKKANKG